MNSCMCICLSLSLLGEERPFLKLHFSGVLENAESQLAQCHGILALETMNISIVSLNCFPGEYLASWQTRLIRLETDNSFVQRAECTEKRMLRVWNSLCGESESGMKHIAAKCICSQQGCPETVCTHKVYA